MTWYFEYIFVFIFVYIILVLVNRSNLTNSEAKKSRKKKFLPTELIYLERVYHLDIKKIYNKSFIYIYSFVNSFIITTIYIILIYLLNNWLLRIILGIILLILMIIICYGLLARYYLKKEGKKDV